jgi:hypothetical protein
MPKNAPKSCIETIRGIWKYMYVIGDPGANFHIELETL